MLNKKLIKFPRTRINQLVLSVPFKAQKEIKLPSLGSNTSQTPRLDLNQTQIVELPDIFRYHTPSPSKAIAIKKFSYDDGSERQMVNLESLIQQEATLAEILELSKSNSICDLNAKLQEYWEVSNNEAFWAIEKLFKDSRTRRSIVASLILESLSLALLMHCNEKQLVFTNINKLLRNLICCMHQNLLTLIDIILTRLPPDVLSSVWVLKLQKTAQAKKVKNLKRGEHFSSLRHHCEMISNCIRTVAHLITNNSALSILLHILTNVDKYSVRAVRSYLLPMKNYSNSVSVPFLTERSSKEFTLVIDLDETLVHFSGRKKKAGELLVRPYCAEFLKDMNELFELVIFTAGVQEYADWAIDLIDGKRFVKYRLYRQHTTQAKGGFVKDLSKLGRDLAKIVIIDNVPGNFQLQMENGIAIKTWIGDKQDRELEKFSKILKEIAENSQDDIRLSVQKVLKNSL